MNTTWMNLKCTLLNERSLFEKVICDNIAFIWHFGKDNNIKIENTSVVAGVQGRLNRWSTGDIILGMWNYSLCDGIVVSMTVWIYQTPRTLQPKSETPCTQM